MRKYREFKDLSVGQIILAHHVFVKFLKESVFLKIMSILSMITALGVVFAVVFIVLSPNYIVPTFLAVLGVLIWVFLKIWVRITCHFVRMEIALQIQNQKLF